MRIQIVSDLHLEFSDINIQNIENADVLVLSGDIMVASKVLKPQSEYGIRFRDFLKRVSFQFPHVIYIMGNHDNVYLLERDTKIINDVVFVGGTLWTDMNKFDPLTLHAVRDMMMDYRAIVHDKAGFRRLKPADTCERHRTTLDYIKFVADEHKDKKVVVCTHHSPSFQSVAEQYKTEYLMNGAYHSSLEEHILDRPQIKLWTHGHTHTPFDYMVGECRVVCKARRAGRTDRHKGAVSGGRPCRIRRLAGYSGIEGWRHEFRPR